MQDMSFEFAAPPAVHLTPKEKAALVVRLLLTEGAVSALLSLPESKQTELAIQLARMAPVDQAAVDSLVREYADAIENFGLSHPAGLDGALGLLDGMISSGASSRLREMSSIPFFNDGPWERVGNIDS